MKFIIRLDDICPRMDWHKFGQVKTLMNLYDIQPIIGVIPNNKDKTLMIDPPKANFWKIINNYQKQGWTIAQHGFEHIYHTQNGGIFQLNQQSEFAGLSLKKQTKMLQSGKNILQQHGIYTDIFMAPSHAMDHLTLKALKATGFNYVTDGFGLYPYKKEGLTFVPQLFASSLNFGIGIYTICLHTNELSQKEIDRLGLFFKTNRAKIISFEESYSYQSNSFWNTTVSSQFFKILRKGKSKLATSNA